MVEMRGAAAAVAGVEGLWASPSARGRLAVLGDDGRPEMTSIRAPSELIAALHALLAR